MMWYISTREGRYQSQSEDLNTALSSAGDTPAHFSSIKVYVTAGMGRIRSAFVWEGNHSELDRPSRPLNHCALLIYLATCIILCSGSVRFYSSDNKARIILLNKSLCVI